MTLNAIMSIPTLEPTAIPYDSGNISWILDSTALVILMLPGLAFFYGGAVSHKNTISTMYQTLIAMAVVSILWVTFTFSLAFGSDLGGIIGNPWTYFMYRDVNSDQADIFAPTIPLSLYFIFELSFAIVTTAVICGGLAERVNFYSWIIFAALWHIFVYCPLVHIVWHPDGLLRKWGVMDYAGLHRAHSLLSQ